jgi:large subunit ribosomal protein L9
MDVILLERIEKLGQMGDVVRVKPGFARNYLLPQKKALRATEQNKKVFESQRAQLEADNLEHRKEAEGVGARLDGLKVVIVRQASDNDQLYGSVTVRNIAQAITEAGFTVDSKQVQMGRPIKTVGMHPVTIRLHPEVSVTITANVARSEDEAELQAQGRRVNAYEDDEEDEVLAEAEAAFDQPADGEADGEAAPAEAEDEADRPA